MSNIELGFFFFGGALMLCLVVLSSRRQDLEQQGNRAGAWLSGLVLALLGASFVLRTTLHWLALTNPQLLVAGLTAGFFSAGAVLMATRAFHMRRSRAERQRYPTTGSS